MIKPQASKETHNVQQQYSWSGSSLVGKAPTVNILTFVCKQTFWLSWQQWHTNSITQGGSCAGAKPAGGEHVHTCTCVYVLFMYTQSTCTCTHFLHQEIHTWIYAHVHVHGYTHMYMYKLTGSIHVSNTQSLKKMQDLACLKVDVLHLETGHGIIPSPPPL